ncbi:hypothetical protein [Mucilaginibacter sp. UYCu711]|uniref:hypothetical protein n=1 Tax=Mucilaginibacter sp. UYCu711 TaxID=3156339 RepID=UPI003D1A9FBE
MSCSTSIKSGSYTESYIDDLSGDTIKIRIDTNVMSKDTFFLKRKTTNGVRTNSIFIDQNKNSLFYNTVFGVSVYDNQNIRYYLNELSKRKAVLSHLNLSDFPTEWRPVVKYRNKYYLYQPSDAGGKGTIMVTDSTLMPYLFGDGYTPIALDSVTKKTDNLYIIKTKHLVSIDQSCPSEVNIFVLDKKTMLAVWEMKNENGTEYRLMVPKATMQYFPIIVNSSTNKEDEFDFETIDYKKLINR